MSNDNKVAQDRKEKVKKDKQELFEKVCLAVISSDANTAFTDTGGLIENSLLLAEAIYQAKKGVV